MSDCHLIHQREIFLKPARLSLYNHAGIGLVSLYSYYQLYLHMHNCENKSLTTSLSLLKSYRKQKLAYSLILVICTRINYKIMKIIGYVWVRVHIHVLSVIVNCQQIRVQRSLVNHNYESQAKNNESIFYSTQNIISDKLRFM